MFAITLFVILGLFGIPAFAFVYFIKMDSFTFDEYVDQNGNIWDFFTIEKRVAIVPFEKYNSFSSLKSNIRYIKTFNKITIKKDGESYEYTITPRLNGFCLIGKNGTKINLKGVE